MDESKTLTDAEFELMAILWRLGEGNVKSVQKQLPEDRQLAYTSISTILRILVKKGFCEVRKIGRNHIYIPLISESEYQSSALSKMVSQVFEGSASGLIRTLASQTKLTDKEKSELLAILDR